jgi:hypothetical protein
MQAGIELNRVYAVSDDVVAREIEDELIIVPLAAGIGDMEDELYTLNEHGRVIWAMLDGSRSLKEIVRELSSEYEAPEGEIEKDVTGLVDELVKRRIVVAG